MKAKEYLRKRGMQPMIYDALSVVFIRGSVKEAVPIAKLLEDFAEKAFKAGSEMNNYQTGWDIEWKYPKYSDWINQKFKDDEAKI